MDIVQIVKDLLTVGLPGILLFQVVVLWRAYEARTQQYLDTLASLHTLEKSVLENGKHLAPGRSEN